MCTDVGIDVCIGMCTDMCIDTCIDTCQVGKPKANLLQKSGRIRDSLPQLIAVRVDIGAISASPTARPYPRNRHAVGNAEIEPM